MTYQERGYAELMWDVRAPGGLHARVFAVNKYVAEREGAIKLGVGQWLCTATLAHNDQLQSLGVA